MTLSDPTAGAGYSTGQVLPSTDMTTIATQQPDAVDGAAGGTYTPTAKIVLNNGGGTSALECDDLDLDGVLNLLTCAATIDATSTVALNGTETVGTTGAITFSSADSTGMTAARRIKLSGDFGRLLHRAANTWSISDDLQIFEADFDTHIITSLNGGNRIVTLGHTGATAAAVGDRMTVKLRDNGGNTCRFDREDTTVIGHFTGGTKASIRFEFVAAGAWEAVMCSPGADMGNV